MCGRLILKDPSNKLCLLRNQTISLVIIENNMRFSVFLPTWYLSKAFVQASKISNQANKRKIKRAVVQACDQASEQANSRASNTHVQCAHASKASREIPGHIKYLLTWLYRTISL